VSIDYIIIAPFRYAPPEYKNSPLCFYCTTAFSLYFSIKRKRDFCQGVWGCLGCRLGRCFCFAEVSAGDPHPNKFLCLSALTIFGESGQCIDKCYACCQRSCRKHSAQKSDDVATKAMLALIKRVSIYFSNFLKKTSSVATSHMLAVNGN